MGWVCSYTPLELIYAAGFMPYRIVGHANPVRIADSYTHSNICHFVKSTIDVAVEGGYDFLEGVVYINSCDAMRRLHDIWKRFIASKFIFFLDLPMGHSSVGVKYLRDEFQKLKEALEKHSSNFINDELLENAIDLYTESRMLFNKLNSLRVENPPLISGKEIMEISSNFFKSNPKSWNESIKTLIQEKKHATHEIENNNPRIILSGSPIHEVDFISLIEDCGLNVIYEDLCTGSKFFDINVKKSEDLLTNLSEAYLNRIPCARMMKIEDRGKYLIEKSQKFNADGIIHHSLKFCDTYLFDVPALKEILNENGISVLFLESDGRLGSFNQLKTRIEAFSEMIK